MNAQAKSYFHRGGELPLLGSTIADHFHAIVRRFPDRQAIVCQHQQRRLTYRELKQAVDEVACGLMAMGYQKGHRLGVWSTDNIEWLLLQMATARIGCILVNINPAYRPRELAYALKKSQVQGLFFIPQFRHNDYVSMLVALIPGLETASSTEINDDQFPDLKHIVLFDPNNPAHTEKPYPGFTLWQDMLEAAQTVHVDRLDAVSASLDCDDPINIQYTSGTTGFPKAVVLSHHNILNNAWFVAHAMHFNEQDRLCVPVPFYHCFGMVLANLLCLSVGACIVVPAEHFEAGAVLKAIAEEKCTAVHGVPTMFIAELEHPDFEQFDLSSLRTGIMAGAPCPPALMTKVMDVMHCKEILIGYGQTEASPITHLTTVDDSFQRRIDTVGHNLPHQEVKIIDTETGATVALNQVGEICFRGYHIMQGYFNDQAATAKAIDDHGWLHSGDLGTMDRDGYVKITGRLKDMIIRGGENIYPREIEDFLFTHPKIAEVAVFGVPDDYYGEELMAWIQLHEGASATEDEIRQYCKDNIAHFKIPKYIWFVKEFPMTVTGKLQKYKMRDMAIKKLQPNDANPEEPSS